MAGEPPITIVGNATADAELKFLPSGVAVANVTVASTPRHKVGDQWEDGETVFYRCAIWRDQAENVAETVKRGMRVIVTGRFKVRPYKTTEGQDRLSLEIDADEIGVALRYGSATFNKAERQAAGAPASAPDPWSTAPPGTGWGQPPAQQGPPPGWAQPAAPQQPAAPPPQAPAGWGPPPSYPEPPY